jgi:hypothetical protein
MGSDTSLLIIIFLKIKKQYSHIKLKGSIITNKLLMPLSSSLVPMAVSPSVAVMINPHTNLCLLEGFSFPLSLNIPNTNMAESTELIIEIRTNPAIKR